MLARQNLNEVALREFMDTLTTSKYLQPDPMLNTTTTLARGSYGA